MKAFSIRDYYRMWQVRGIRLPVEYFFQNHLFDIIHGTDTHFRLDTEDYEEHPEGFESGGFYMCSCTNQVKKSLKLIEKKLGDDFFHYQFIDLGCGKCKAPMIYSFLYGKSAHHKPIGIDYYKPLIDIANKNLILTGLPEKVSAIYGDARKFQDYTTSSNLIFYLYNPFGEDILKDILERSTGNNVYILYTHPVCQQAVLDMGFDLIYSKKGHYPSTTTSIFYRRKSK